MQFFATFLFLVTLVFAEDGQFEQNPAYGYMKNIGIPLAEKIRKAEELQGSRIIGGVPAARGQYPFQAGLLGDIIQDDVSVGSVCGGALISDSRVLTAAHCWFDGVYQAWRFTVVLGSNYLFSGGKRVQTSAVAVHPSWIPALARNDIAVVYLPGPVALSDTIAPIALPSGQEIFESFTGERAITVGFGVTGDDEGFSSDQQLSHVSLSVISNNECFWAFPLFVQGSNICTSGLGNFGFCYGDTGGPLIITRNNRPLLIGVASFRSNLGCEINLPNAFARVTSFMDFINRHVQ